MNDSQTLTPEILDKLKRIQFRMRSLVSETFSGEYVSAFKGQGIEFEEVRPYQAGDEIRLIDWNVTARTGEPFIKIYREERELTVYFVVDVSASMRFGTTTQFKSEIAAEITALLAYAALKNNDKIGLIIFSDHVEHYLPPKKDRAHIWRVIRDILSHKSKAHRTDLALPLEFLDRVAKRKSVVFLVSDFFGEDYEKTLRRIARKHDVIALSITDPKEKSLPAIGMINFKDAETGEVFTADARHFLETNFKKNNFSAAKIDQISISTETSYVEPLVRFFRSREKRR